MDKVAVARELVKIAKSLVSFETVRGIDMYHQYVKEGDTPEKAAEKVLDMITSGTWAMWDDYKVKKAIADIIQKAGGGAGPQSEPMDPRVAELPHLSLSDIASLIYDDHRKQKRQVNYAAKPYLEALTTLQKITDNYMMDSGTSIVAYMLGNLTSWKGEVAKAVKKELNRRLKSAH